MEIVRLVVLILLGTFPIACVTLALAMAYAAEHKPMLIANLSFDANGRNARGSRKQTHRWVALAAGIAALIGIGFFVYGGIHAALWSVPSSWGSVEDGEFTPVKETLATIAAIFASPFIFQWLLNYALKSARQRHPDLAE